MFHPLARQVHVPRETMLICLFILAIILHIDSLNSFTCPPLAATTPSQTPNRASVYLRAGNNLDTQSLMSDVGRA